ncbi:hypothetical protein LJB95_02150 [Paludibacteraceae bacterium OttesenSCG-928-F17]|nr:hypothetical protein [Paludibacteraceae bacterium OttesenSCG-928-F17]
MENLIKRLQNEAGLTEEQAHKAWEIMRDFLDEEGFVDYNKIFKDKYDEFKDSTKSFITDVSGKAEDFGEKVADKVSDMSIHAKRMARDFSKKMYEELNEDLKKQRNKA